ncbi:MAG: gamma-glutamyl-gamma-aminobutyrate hydrolase family protein [Gemmatimonadaceae bacterium]
MRPLPIVAVTATSEIIRGTLRVRVNESYTRAVEQAGGIPLIVAPFTSAEAAPELAARLLARVDALVLTGGEDVDPALYGASAHPALGTTHRARDATEIALIHAAHERRTPTLAICRGIQTLNVAFGGTLVQDIPSERQGSLDHDAASNRGSRVHDVEIELGSRLESVLGTSRLRANSFHHQSLDRLGEGLRVTAMAPDGIIEAAEWVRDDWWAVAVQWHPEELCEAPEPWDRSLFRALCDRAASTAVPFAAASASG